MGNMNEMLNINGQAIAQSGVFSAIAPGGLLAQPTNIGSFSQNRFALIPQVNVKLGYQVLPGLRLTMGYNFTYVTRVLRPGDQVDTTVNGTQIAGGTLIGPARHKRCSTTRAFGCRASRPDSTLPFERAAGSFRVVVAASRTFGATRDGASACAPFRRARRQPSDGVIGSDFHGLYRRKVPWPNYFQSSRV